MRLKDGRTLSYALPDVVPADIDLIRRRFRNSAASVVGRGAATELEAAVDALDKSDDVGALMRMTMRPA